MILEVRDLSRVFGALSAVDAVTLAFSPGQIHAVIGPNGAGKTTLLNLLSGELSPSAGRILLAGEDITALSPARRARLGLGRTYQRTTVFADLTCLEHAWLGARASVTVWPRLLGSRTADATIDLRARQALDRVGLVDRATDRAGSLSHGEHGQLELAMVLAASPSVLLLDEPLAGMGREESDRMATLVRDLTPERTVILVEHDMDAVFAVADTLTVMVAGRVLDTGAPAAVRANVAVQDAYLGASTIGGDAALGDPMSPP